MESCFIMIVKVKVLGIAAPEKSNIHSAYMKAYNCQF